MTEYHPRGFRAHVTLGTELVVCHALMSLAMTGDDERAEASIAALHELGYNEAAAHLDSALAVRRALQARTMGDVACALSDETRVRWSPGFRALFDDALGSRRAV